MSLRYVYILNDQRQQQHQQAEVGIVEQVPPCRTEAESSSKRTKLEFFDDTFQNSSDVW